MVLRQNFLACIKTITEYFEPLTLNADKDDYNGSKAITVPWGKRNPNTVRYLSINEPVIQNNPNGYASILKDDIVCIDVDDIYTAEKLLNIIKREGIKSFAVRTLDGIHFYFKQDCVESPVKKHAKDMQLACGIIADIKPGNKNAYAILKIQGKEREVLMAPENGIIDELPAWLYPLKVNEGVQYLNVVDLKEGGRNNSLIHALYYIFNATGTIENTRTTCRIINKYLFAEALDDNEIKTITRDSIFASFNYRGNSLNPDDKQTIDGHRKVSKGNIIRDISLSIISDYLVRSKNFEFSFMYEGQRISNTQIMMNIIEDRFNTDYPELDYSDAREDKIITYLKRHAPMETRNDDIIRFNNCQYNIITGEIEEIDINITPAMVIPEDYNPNEDTTKIVDYIMTFLCGDTEAFDELLRYCAYTFYPRNEMRKMMILKGDPGCGKSTFIKLMADIHGENNTASIDIEEIHEPVMKDKLRGKTLVTCGEMTSDMLLPKAIRTLKAVISGDSITGAGKYKDPVTFSPTCKLFFATNELPSYKDPTGAFNDRIQLIECRHKHFGKNLELNRYLESSEAKRAMIKLCMDYLPQVIHSEESFSKEFSILAYYNRCRKNTKAKKEKEISKKYSSFICAERVIGNTLNQITEMYCEEHCVKDPIMIKNEISKALNMTGKYATESKRIKYDDGSSKVVKVYYERKKVTQVNKYERNTE